MKAKIIMEFEEDFIDFVMREGHLKNSDELKGFLRELYANTVEQEKGVKHIEVIVEE